LVFPEESVALAYIVFEPETSTELVHDVVLDAVDRFMSLL
jgi:hypothetical protein